MVPTEEERLPVRVSISVRGLSALLRSPPITFLSFIRFSHICITLVMLHAGQRPNEHSLFFTRQLLLIEFPLLCSAFCVRSRSILAGHLSVCSTAIR